MHSGGGWWSGAEAHNSGSMIMGCFKFKLKPRPCMAEKFSVAAPP